MKFRIKQLPFITYINSYNFSSKINNPSKSRIKFENKSENFWMNRTANIDAMCGVGELNEEDLAHSKQIFEKLNLNKKISRVLDVGAGIGRITFNVLYDRCEKIDMVDINKKFLESALIKEKEMKGNKIEKIYSQKIQDFKFEYSYDLIFVQWVLEYLKEENFIKFLSNVVVNLKDDGFLIIKENVNLSDDRIIYIEEEGSLIRPPKFFENGFKKVGLIVKNDELVVYKSIKEEIYDVKCWVLTKF
jgi:protein N-terminal methyltransferase